METKKFNTTVRVDFDCLMDLGFTPYQALNWFMSGKCFTDGEYQHESSDKVAVYNIALNYWQEKVNDLRNEMENITGRDMSRLDFVTCCHLRDMLREMTECEDPHEVFATLEEWGMADEDIETLEDMWVECIDVDVFVNNISDSEKVLVLMSGVYKPSMDYFENACGFWLTFNMSDFLNRLPEAETDYSVNK